jgi:hypothetical protein
VVIDVPVDGLVELTVNLVQVTWIVHTANSRLAQVGNGVSLGFFVFTLLFVFETACIRNTNTSWILTLTDIVIVGVKGFSSSDPTLLFLDLLLLLFLCSMSDFFLFG